MESPTGLLTRGSLPRRLPGLRQWLRGGGASPLTAAGPSRIRTGFPHRAPDWGRAYHRTVPGSFARIWLPVARVGGGDLRVLVRSRTSVPGSAAGTSSCASSPTPRSTRSWARSSSARPAAPGSRSGSESCTPRATSPPDLRRGTPRLADRRRDRRGRRGVRDRPLASRSSTPARVSAPHVARRRPRRDRRHAPLWRAWLESVRSRARASTRRSCPRIAREPQPRSTGAEPGTGERCSSASARTTRRPISAATRATSAALRSLAANGAIARRVHGRARAARARRARAARRRAAGLGASRPEPALSIDSSPRSGPEAIVVRTRDDLLSRP